MEQILFHLIGDYLIQTDNQATTKTKQSLAALKHATTYTLPFLLLTQSTLALAVICLTHFVIDRFRLARFVIFVKNWVADRSLRWADCAQTGYHSDRPAWLAVWLLIIADNTIHMTINYAALRWL